MNLKVTVLGSGTSHGVPSIGCDCAVCRSADPRDRRLRPSIVVELQPEGPQPPLASAVRSILIDTSTDLRTQALTHDLRRVDAILFTHSHADHVLGLDETRRYNAMQEAPIGCYGASDTLADIRGMFSYIFRPPRQHGGGVPQLKLFELAGPFTMGGLDIVPVPLWHGRLPILGYRMGAFAYLTDCSRIPDASWSLLEGVRVLVIGALRHRPHPTHFSVAEALEAVARIGPTRAYFTHICHDLPHAETCAALPDGVQLAYDGLVLDVRG
ncbi:MAG: MBL fold metallo-hydrolase [Acidobacteriota bacterium]